jgi:hypothetical protein
MASFRGCCFVSVVAVLLGTGLVTPAFAQEPAPSAGGEDSSTKTGRLFGVLPNTSTVEPNTPYGPVTTRQMFYFATDDSFDKAVYPFVGVVAYFGVGQSAESYWERYATSFADNALGNYMVTAIFPLAFHQDPRYFVRGHGNFFARAGYAASRAVITRSRDGGAAFNVSELAGNLAAAAASNLYHPAADRTASSVAARAGSQVMWDVLAFESKEFWPDIRTGLKQIFKRQ